jgi:hypothetical protein
VNSGLALSVLGWAAACRLAAEEARPRWVLQLGLEEESQEREPAALRALREEAQRPAQAELPGGAPGGCGGI